MEELSSIILSYLNSNNEKKYVSKIITKDTVRINLNRNRKIKGIQYILTISEEKYLFNKKICQIIQSIESKGRLFSTKMEKVQSLIHAKYYISTNIYDTNIITQAKLDELVHTYKPYCIRRVK